MHFLIRNSIRGLYKTKLKFPNVRTLTGLSVTYKENGDPEKVLELCEYAVDENVAGTDVLVKMLAAPINPADINMIQGKYALKPTLPAVGGNEGVGEIIKIGSAVTSLKVGDRVIPSEAGKGTWKTHKICKENDLIKIDPSISLVAAATITVNPCTAYRMLLDFMPLKEGDTVIQNGANSGVGQAVIQISKFRKLNTVNVVRERPNMGALEDYLMGLGATYVVTDTGLRSKQMDEIFQKIPKATLALNCVGGKSAAELTRHMKFRSTMVTYGGMSKQPLTISTASLIFNDIKYRGYWMTQWYKENSAEERDKMMAEIVSMIKQNCLKPPPCDEVKLADFKDAIVKSMESFVSRKQVLVMD